MAEKDKSFSFQEISNIINDNKSYYKEINSTLKTKIISKSYELRTSQEIKNWFKLVSLAYDNHMEYLMSRFHIPKKIVSFNKTIEVNIHFEGSNLYIDYGLEKIVLDFLNNTIWSYCYDFDTYIDCNDSILKIRFLQYLRTTINLLPEIIEDFKNYIVSSVKYIREETEEMMKEVINGI